MMAVSKHIQRAVAFILPLLVISASALNFTDYCNKTVSAGRSGGELQFFGVQFNFVCVVSIKADSGRRILLTPAGPASCRNADGRVQVYDGSSTLSPRIGDGICSTGPLSGITSTSNHITLRFVTTYSFGIREVFPIAYASFTSDSCRSDEFMCKNHRCIDSSLENNNYDNCGDNSDEYIDFMEDFCGRRIDAQSSGGVLKSQRSDNYDNNVDCTMTIRGRRRRILLTFSEVDIEGKGYICEQDHLQVSSDLNIGGICGTTTPNFITSESSEVTLKFTTSDSVTGRGFTIAYTSFGYCDFQGYGTGCVCDIGEFQCDNLLCIDPSLVSNGYDNCGDNSDEGLSGGQIAGIVCGTVVALTIIIIIAIVGYRVYRNRK